MLEVTDEMRSMIAGVMIAGADCDVGRHNCMCCGPQSHAICAAIVGEEYAKALEVFAHDELGCGWDADFVGVDMDGGGAQSIEDSYLHKIMNLTALRDPAEDSQQYAYHWSPPVQGVGSVGNG